MNKLKKLLFLSVLSCSVYSTFAQNVSVGEKEFDAHPSAILELQSTSKGVLIPRLNAVQRSAIPVDSLSVGLLVYQTDSTSGFYYFDGRMWKCLNTQSAEILSGNLADVAMTGDYNDLQNIPAMFDSNYFTLKNQPSFQDSIAEYGFDGEYSNLKNIPAPFDSNYFALKNRPSFQDSIAEYGFDGEYSNLKNIPVLFDSNYFALKNLPSIQDSISKYGFDGEYSNLKNIPAPFDSNYFALKNLPSIQDSISKYGFDGEYSSVKNIPAPFDSNYWALKNRPVLFDSNYLALKNLPSMQDSITKYGFDGEYSKLKNVPPEFTPKVHQHIKSDISDFSHTHTTAELPPYPTLSSLGAAPVSHGNHVPKTQSVNNAVFLRNDNTWQAVVPANIGAATSSHTHTKANITDFSHTHTRQNITDFAHNHNKSNITDFAHTHSRSEITDLAQELAALKTELASLRATEFSKQLPVGTIVMWTGAQNAIPKCWAIVEAMAGKFPVGVQSSGGKYTVAKSTDSDNKSGQNEIVLTTDQLAYHNHAMEFKQGSRHSGAGSNTGFSPLEYAYAYTGSEVNHWGATWHAGKNQAHENRPPFYGVYFIKKTTNTCN